MPGIRYNYCPRVGELKKEIARQEQILHGFRHKSPEIRAMIQRIRKPPIQAKIDALRAELRTYRFSKKRAEKDNPC